MKLRQFIEEPVFKNGNASEPIYNTCTAYLKEFGKTTAKFIQCSIEKARPFRFCEMCVVQYKRAMTIFEDILQVCNVIIIKNHIFVFELKLKKNS